MNSIMELEKPKVEKKKAPKAPATKTSRRIRMFFRCLFMVCVIKVGILATLVLTPTSFEMAQNTTPVEPQNIMLADADDGRLPSFMPAIPPAQSAQTVLPEQSAVSPEQPEQPEQATQAAQATAEQSAPKKPTDIPVTKKFSGVAFAAEPMPAPNVRSLPSPVSADALSKPDQAIPGAPPPPTVEPIPNKDSASIKQEELNRREQELLALQQQMESRMQELNELEGKVGNMLQNATQTQDDKIKQLVDMYAAMKPKQAAAVLETLDDKIAVQVLSNLKPKQAGEILSYMKPTRTAVLSELLTKMQIR